MLKTEGLGKNQIGINESYKNTIKAYNMAKEKMCSNSQSDHDLPHCKYDLRCFA